MLSETPEDVNHLTPPTSKGSISTTHWDQDTQVIPRLQIVDEHQKFT